MNTEQNILGSPTGMTIHPILACLQAMFDLSMSRAYNALPAKSRNRATQGGTLTVDEAIHAIQSVFTGRIDIVRGHSAREPKPISLVVGTRKGKQTACLWLPNMVWNPATGPMEHGEWLRESTPLACITPIGQGDIPALRSPKRESPQPRGQKPDPKEAFKSLFK